MNPKPDDPKPADKPIGSLTELTPEERERKTRGEEFMHRCREEIEEKERQEKEREKNSSNKERRKKEKNGREPGSKYWRNIVK